MKNNKITGIIAFILLIASVIAISIMVYANGIDKDTIIKDRAYAIGSTENPYTILEIVPDDAYAEIGYLIGGNEPTNLNSLIESGKITADNVESILESLNGAIKIDGTKETAYSIIKDQDWVNYLDVTLQEGRENSAHTNIENINGYYENVGENNGSWSAHYTGDTQTEYLAKSWENDPDQDYLYVYIDDIGYAEIDINNRTEYYRFDGENYISYSEDTANGVDTTLYDYAYKTFILNGSNIYVILNKISSETYRKVDDARVIDYFTYVGSGNGDWEFRNAVRSKKFTFNSNSYIWEKSGNGQTEFSIIWTTIHNQNSDMGVGTKLLGTALADIGDEVITEFKFSNNELFKTEVLGLSKNKIDSYQTKVITKTINEITITDIDNADLIYFNNGGDEGSYRYDTIVKLYKMINNKDSAWKPSETTLGSNTNSNYTTNHANEIISRIFSRVVLGTTEVSYTNNIVNVYNDSKPVVIFDSSMYDYAVANPNTSNYIDYIEKYKLDDTSKDINNLIYKNTNTQYMYDNSFIKLYIIMNQMYPQIYYKHYLEGYITDEIDLKYLNLTNTYDRNAIINKNNSRLSSINAEILLPVDIYGKYGLADNYSLMGIDNSTLTANYLAEHNVLSFNSNRDNNLIYAFNKNIIGRTDTTSEVFDTMNYSSDTMITVAQALDYLVNHQIVNIIDKPELSILEIQPSNSFISEKDWAWKVSGLAPYYMGNLSEFNTQTTQMSMRQFIGVNIDLINNYDLIYIGDDNGAIITTTDTDQYLKQDYSVNIKVGETKNVVPSDFLCVSPKNGTDIIDVANSVGDNGNIVYSIANNIITVTGIHEGEDIIRCSINMKISDKETISKNVEFNIYVESKDNKKISLGLSDSNQSITKIGEYEYIHSASGDSWTHNYAPSDYSYTSYSIGNVSSDLIAGNLYYITGTNNDSHTTRNYSLFESYNYNNKALKTRYDADLSTFKDINGSINPNSIWELQGDEDNYYFRNVGSGDYINLTKYGTTTNGVLNNVTLVENKSSAIPLSIYFKDYNNYGWTIYTYIDGTGSCLNSSGKVSSDYTWNYGNDVTVYPYAGDKEYRSWWSVRNVNKTTSYGGYTYLSPKEDVNTYNYFIGVQPDTVYAIEMNDGIARNVSIEEFNGYSTIEGKTYDYSSYYTGFYRTNQLLDNASNGTGTILFKTSSNCSSIMISANKDIPSTFVISKIIGLDDKEFTVFNGEVNGSSILDDITPMEYEQIQTPVYEVGNLVKANNGKELAVGNYILKNNGNVGNERKYYLLSKDSTPHLTDSLNTVDGSLDKHYIWYYNGEYFKNVETGKYMIILDNSAYFSDTVPDFKTKIYYNDSNDGWSIAYTPEWSTNCGGSEHTHVPKPTLDPEENKYTYVNCGWGGWQVEETTALEWKLECDKDEHQHTKDHKKYNSQSKMKKFWKKNSNKTLGCYTLYRYKQDDEWHYYWGRTCKKDEHTHTKIPDTVPSYKGQTSGCYEAVEITKYDWVNHCTQPEHTHNNGCYTHYYLYGTSEENVSGTTDLSKPSAYWDIYEAKYNIKTENIPCLYITKVFKSSDIASNYKESNKDINGLTVDYINNINASKAYDITFELTDTSGNPDYISDVDNSRFIIKSKYQTEVYKLTLTAKYKTIDNPKEQETHIYFTIYEIPDISNSAIDLYQPVYNDSNMKGLLYTHIGDWYPIHNLYNDTYSRIYYDGALQKNGRSDLNAGLLSTYNSGDYIVVNGRFSGNDLTSHKAEQMQQFINADLPIIVADGLANIDNNGNVVSINKNAIDDSSYLYEFLNNNRNKIMHASQNTSNVWNKAFSKSISLTVYSKPRIYDNSDNGGIVEDTDYLSSRELRFSVDVRTLLEDDQNEYGVKLYIDNNCDGIFSDTEELKNITVKEHNGSVISSERIKANTGEPYDITKIIPDEYFGVISWKLEFYNTSNKDIHKSISGISALNTNSDERPNIIVLQVKPAYQTSYGYINLDLDSTRYKYGSSYASESDFYSYMENLKDFNISVMSATASRLLDGDNVKDIFAYKVTTKIYKSLDLTETNEVKSELIPYNPTYLTITDDSTSGDVYTVYNKPITYTPGTSVLTLEEASLTGYDYNNYLGNYVIQEVYGTAEINGVPVTQRYYVYRFIQGVGFEEIYDYPNGDDHINESDINEVIAIDMIIMGFGDWSYYTSNDNLINAITNHVRNGKTILMTHDCMSYHSMEGDSTNSMNDVGDKYRYKLYYALKDLINVNRYSHDTAWMPKTSRTSVATYAQQGWTDSALVMTLQRTARTHAEYLPFYKGNELANSNKLYNHPINSNPDYQDTDYNSTRTDNTVLTTLTHAEIVNRGQITEYPYYIDDIIDISLTHHQYWQLDLEDEVAVWLTLRAEAAGYENYNRDTRNNYYIYSKGNIVYTGMGHSSGITDDEIKLFVNTIVSSYRNNSIGTQLVINDNEASVYGSDTYIYLDSDYSTEDLGHANLDEMNNQKLKFNIIDNNLITNSKINIEFSAVKPGVNASDVNLKNFDSLTDIILSTEVSGSDNGKIRIYKYLDDISNATLLEANEDGEFTVSPEYNYYLSLPEDIIEWAVQRVNSSDSNSFTMYARMTLKYSTRLDSDEEIYTKRIQTLQRVVFIKRGLFFMD